MGLKTVERIGPLLDLFTPEQQVLRLSEIASALAVPRSTAHGLLDSLVSIGLLTSPTRGRYELGPKIGDLNRVLAARIDLRSVASPALHELSAKLGETVNLGVLRGDRIVYLDKIAGMQHVTVVGARIGAQIEAARSAMGRAIIAHGDERQRRAFCQQGRGGPANDEEKAGRNKMLTAIRRDGFAVDLGEISPEIRCIAAAVRGVGGEAVGAISVSTTPPRFERSKRQIAEAVVAAARTVEDALAR